MKNRILRVLKPVCSRTSGRMLVGCARALLVPSPARRLERRLCYFCGRQHATSKTRLEALSGTSTSIQPSQLPQQVVWTVHSNSTRRGVCDLDPCAIGNLMSQIQIIQEQRDTLVNPSKPKLPSQWAGAQHRAAAARVHSVTPRSGSGGGQRQPPLK